MSPPRPQGHRSSGRRGPGLWTAAAGRGNGFSMVCEFVWADLGGFRRINSIRAGQPRSQPNLGLGERRHGVVRGPCWSWGWGWGWTASGNNSQRPARPDRLANVRAAQVSPRAAGRTSAWHWDNPRSDTAAWLSQSCAEYGTGWEKVCVSQKHGRRFIDDFLFLRNKGGQKAEIGKGRTSAWAEPQLGKSRNRRWVRLY
jgi:hypothetical protein